MWRHACRKALLAVGPSSVAQALIAHWDAAGMGAGHAAATTIEHAQGPVLVMSGSRSPVTAAQIEAATSYQRIPMDAAVLCAGEGDAYRAMWSRVAASLSQGRHVLAYVADESTQGRAAPASVLAQACGRFLARVLANSR